MQDDTQDDSNLVNVPVLLHHGLRDLKIGDLVLVHLRSRLSYLLYIQERVAINQEGKMLINGVHLTLESQEFSPLRNGPINADQVERVELLMRDVPEKAIMYINGFFYREAEHLKEELKEELKRMGDFLDKY